MKQQAAELSVKEDHPVNAPVPLEEGELGPGKTLHDH